MTPLLKPLSLSLFALAMATAAQAAERQAKIEITKLSCPSCPYIAAKAIRDVASSNIIEVDYDPAAQRAVYLVGYDDAVTTAAAIAAAPAEYGYPGRVLDDGPQS